MMWNGGISPRLNGIIKNAKMPKWVNEEREFCVSYLDGNDSFSIKSHIREQIHMCSVMMKMLCPNNNAFIFVCLSVCGNQYNDVCAVCMCGNAMLSRERHIHISQYIFRDRERNRNKQEAAKRKQKMRAQGNRGQRNGCWLFVDFSSFLLHFGLNGC